MVQWGARQRRLTRPPLRRRPDHDANRIMLEAVLRRRGYTTLHAPDGSAAVTLAEERRFDVILMVRAEWGIDSARVDRRMLTWKRSGGELRPDSDGTVGSRDCYLGRTHAHTHAAPTQASWNAQTYRYERTFTPTHHAGVGFAQFKRRKEGESTRSGGGENCCLTEFSCLQDCNMPVMDGWQVP